jgi:hypothetical protein
MKRYVRFQVYSCPRQLEDTIVRLEKQLGLSKSQLFLIAFMDYLKEKGLMKERLKFT